MEKKYVKVPFDVEMAKRISNGEVDGKIITRDGRSVRIVCWDLKSIKNDYSILSIVNDAKEENPLICTFKGLFDIEAESRNDLMLEIPEYMTFKDGDIIAYDDNDSIVILKGEPIVGDDGFVSFNFYVDMYRSDLNIYSKKVSLCVDNARKATPKEIEKLKNRLEKDDRQEAREYLKRFFPEHSNSLNIGKNYEFKPFDKVLVRDDSDKKWIPNFYWCKGDIAFRTINGTFWNQCIPYNEQTAHLIGKTDDWKE